MSKNNSDVIERKIDVVEKYAVRESAEVAVEENIRQVVEKKKSQNIDPDSIPVPANHVDNTGVIFLLQNNDSYKSNL